ncbi:MULTISPECIES: type II toxin-antitoxin system RelE/ParE family toxin [Flectobacillus]|jgi:phage-related protein|uniref:Type II toxin-antitoxin system RelE/ParE family toxin n=1 Tax=Flectobacillus roseus TaxID=502259 RepID=A0ABT6Y9B7_9BACT|nr:type II toxin-antitoxin system RelE/ParE family toxin [Flectobacillus roseus]MDI9860179.1 type II toxin-antitoxin system RelE/ParE family toxin [Flectobacillus roseus]MDI9868398.1 type II toxin-antitoxin system RelE/ParE family toxin [Flectobacillus roseus]NBA74325.1 type II toxin-antitoxin system RelE/ParE family toxin [Emticicia sp. ODNR4P]
MKYFETIFMEEANDFIASLDAKIIRKIIYNIDLAEQTNDPKLFKKLQHDIWEFRTQYLGLQIRLLAFWDKTNQQETLVIATHGFIKKVDKIPANEINRAIRLREKYYNLKNIQ